MPTFSYEAINEIGNPISGEVEADSVEMASEIIASRGLIPSRVTEGRKVSANGGVESLKERFTKVTPQELILFTKQFRTMIRAGVPMLNLLQVLENQTENSRLKKVLGTMSRDIKEGASLYDAFAAHPDTFSSLYRNMIQAGEASGALPEVLDRMTYIIEHEHKIKSDIKSALQYPMFVIIALVTAFFVLLLFVIPKFVRIFAKAGLELPMPTKLCIFMYETLTHYWYFILGGLFLIIAGLFYYLGTEQGKYMRDSILMKIPVVGPLFIKAAMSRFASIFAILQSSGVTVLDSMEILSGTIGNYAISREFDHISRRLEEGHGISGPLSSAKYFTPMVINMVAIGEETGHLDEMLTEVANHYDTEVEYAVDQLSGAIGPLMTVGLAVVVGFFALAIFLPMWDLAGMAH